MDLGTSQSRHVIFADESGDHGLTNISSHGRAFVIAMAIFERDLYEQIAVPASRQFKLRHFGDEQVILHEREIRRGDGPFRRLPGTEQRDRARRELRALLTMLPFRIVAVGLDKRRFRGTAPPFESPYEIQFLGALLACAMAEPDIAHSPTPTEIVADSRGRKEDAELRELVQEASMSNAPVASDFRFRVRFAKKDDLEIGVEIADLIANPIAQHILGLEHPLVPVQHP